MRLTLLCCMGLVYCGNMWSNRLPSYALQTAQEAASPTPPPPGPSPPPVPWALHQTCYVHPANTKALMLNPGPSSCLLSCKHFPPGSPSFHANHNPIPCLNPPPPPPPSPPPSTMNSSTPDIDPKMYLHRLAVVQFRFGWEQLQAEQCGQGHGSSLHPPRHDLLRCALLCRCPCGESPFPLGCSSLSCSVPTASVAVKRPEPVLRPPLSV